MRTTFPSDCILTCRRINEDAKTIKSLEEDISSTKAVLTDKGIALNEACKQFVYMRVCLTAYADERA